MVTFRNLKFGVTKFPAFCFWIAFFFMYNVKFTFDNFAHYLKVRNMKFVTVLYTQGFNFVYIALRFRFKYFFVTFCLFQIFIRNTVYFYIVSLYMCLQELLLFKVAQICINLTLYAAVLCSVLTKYKFKFAVTFFVINF